MNHPRGTGIRAESVLRVVIAALLVLGQPLAPATITVNGTGSAVADEGECSLREAITAANTDTSSGSMVGECPAGSGTDEILLTANVELNAVDNPTDGPNGLPSVISAITIEGSGRSIMRSSAGATDDFRIFHIGFTPSAGDLTLNEVTVGNGRVTSANAEGGGIFNAGNLTLTNSTISGNTANGVSGSAYGGGIYSTGYYGYGVLEITNSTISNNSALGSLLEYPSSGDALGGGLLSFDGTLTISNSSLSANTVSAYLAYGGGLYSNDSGSIENSTISSNAAYSSYPTYSAAYDTGSGIRISGSSFTITNSTIAGNLGTYASSGGISPSGTITWTANIAAGNTPLNCDAFPTDGGANFGDDMSCGMGFASLTGFETSLSDNGGPTMTHALLAGSSAIDTAGACGLLKDQRGAPRFDGTCDSGAFEFGGCPLLVLTDDTVVATEVFEECEITAGPNFTVVGPNGDLTLTAGTSVTIFNGFAVQADGIAAIGNDPNLQILSAMEAAAEAGFEVP